MTSEAPAQPAVPAIQMTDIAFGAIRAPERMVAEGVNWTVNAGEYWVVAGLHGAGKSDFLMLTGGLMPPLRGQYLFFGEPMPIFEEARLKQRLRLGVVFDGGQLFNDLTVADNVALPLRYHHNLTNEAAVAEVHELLRQLELEPLAERAPGTLGRGWQKRTGLARALALKPEVLLVDNPLAGLDPRHVRWWLEFLDHLSRGHSLVGGRPVTLAVTTADFRLWKGRARQFAILQNRGFTVLGGWRELEAANQALVREVLTEQSRSE